MIGLPESVAHAVEGWAHFYSKTKAVSMGVTYVHFAGLLLGGGAAVAADRATLRAAKEPEPKRADHLAFLGSVHTVAIAGLGMLFVSGVLMLLADLEMFWGSRVFWTKMALVALLLLNGLLMKHAEGLAASFPDRAWQNLKTTSIASLVLWFTIVLAGVILTTSS